jgi:hypothetical protein
MNEKLTIEDALKQPGGYRQIQYGEMVVVAPLVDIRHALQALEQMPPARRESTLRSVNRALKRALPSVSSGTAAQKKAMAFGQDIAIWFANEVLNGRASLEETRH